MLEPGKYPLNMTFKEAAHATGKLSGFLGVEMTKDLSIDFWYNLMGRNLIDTFLM